MIISYDEYIQKIKEIEKLENKVLKQHHKICELEKQLKELITKRIIPKSAWSTTIKGDKE